VTPRIGYAIKNWDINLEMVYEYCPLTSEVRTAQCGASMPQICQNRPPDDSGRPQGATQML
jgi:hypothetical protein